MNGFERVVVEWIGRARREGLRVSTSETLDAVRALTLVGLHNPTDVRTALRLTVVKTQEDLPRFEASFEHFFALRNLGSPSIFDCLKELGFTNAELSVFQELVANAPERIQALVQLAQDASMLEIRLQNAMLAMTWKGAPAFAHPEAVRRLVGLHATADEWSWLQRVLEGALGDRGIALRHALEEEFSRRQRDRLAIQLPQKRFSHPSLRPLELLPLVQMSLEDLAKVEAAVTHFASTLVARLKRTPRLPQRLDVRATLHRAQRTFGVPLVLEPRRPRNPPPKLALFCDVSESMRHVTALWFLCVSHLRKRLPAMRAFAFVSEVAEITSAFRQSSARSSAFAHLPRDLNLNANSNYGYAFQQLAQWRPALDKRTTLVIVGDARSHFLPPHIEALYTLQKSVKRILWLNPEAPEQWGSGDSLIHQYQPYVDAVLPVHNLQALQVAAKQLIMAAAPPLPHRFSKNRFP